MKLALCTIAKNENDYINDWCCWHLMVGFDHIYIYDNNNDKTKYVGDCINNAILSKITIINVHNKIAYQSKAYNDCYNRFGKEYDWIAFIDVDEFFMYDRKKYKSIKDFVSESMFKNAVAIRPCWQIYGDDDMIYGDISVPVWKRITKPLQSFENRKAKCIVRTKINGLIFNSAHSPFVNGKVIGHVDTVGRKVYDKIFLSKPCYANCYINHYITKTLSEFCRNKIGRGDAVYGNIKIGEEYYFNINKRTKEKENYIKQFL